MSFGLYTGIEVVPGQIHMLSFPFVCACAGDVVRVGVESCGGCKFTLDEGRKVFGITG